MVNPISCLIIYSLFTCAFMSSRNGEFVFKNRILIIQSHESQSLWFSESLKKDLLERKLLVFHFDEGFLVESNFKGDLDTADFLKLIPEKADHSPAWVLVGLDGGVKNSGHSIPSPGEIFRIIDAMPMRQSERLKKGNQDNSSNNWQ